MLQSRRRAILSLISERGTVSVQELVDELSVSEATVRRDLAHLESRSLIRRTWGGATTPDFLDAGPFWPTISGEQSLEKTRIGQKAAELVRPGQSVAIENGGTTFELARALLKVPRLQVITNSLQIAYLMNAHGRCDEVILTGGTLRTDTYMQGPLTQSVLERFRVDISFIGATTLSIERGITESDLLRAQIKQTFMRVGRTVVLLAASSKIGTESPVQVESLASVQYFVTTPMSEECTLEAIRDMGVEVILC